MEYGIEKKELGNEEERREVEVDHQERPFSQLNAR